MAYAGKQYTMVVESYTGGGEDVHGYECTVECVYSDDTDIIAVGDRVALTWAFVRINEYQTPGEPGYFSRNWNEFRNKAAYDAHVHADTYLLEILSVLDIPPMPAMPPQLLSFGFF